MTEAAPPHRRGSEHTRAAILDAALALFVDRGFHGTAVPAVAQRARVGAGTIYRHFASKEALVNALYQHWKKVLTDRVLAGFPAQAAPRAQFHALWSAIAGFVHDHPRAFAFLELHHHASYLDDDSRRIEGDLIVLVEQFVTDAQRRGALRPGPPALLVSLAWGAFTGLVRAQCDGRLTLAAPAWHQAETWCWDALRARPGGDDTSSR